MYRAEVYKVVVYSKIVHKILCQEELNGSVMYLQSSVLCNGTIERLIL